MRRPLNKLLARFGYEIQKVGRTSHLLRQLARERAGGEIRFIQVGANDGISFDNLYEFVTSHNCRGLAIEPLPHFFDRLKLNYLAYPKIVPLQVAVHATSRSMPLFSVRAEAMARYPTWVAGIGSGDRDHLTKLGIAPPDILETHVPCRPLMELAREHGLESLDYLQVDTEGFDDEIIRQLDFGVMRPRIIKFEVVHLGADRKADLLDVLRRAGYKLLDDSRDMVAVR